MLGCLPKRYFLRHANYLETSRRPLATSGWSMQLGPSHNWKSPLSRKVAQNLRTSSPLSSPQYSFHRDSIRIETGPRRGSTSSHESSPDEEDGGCRLTKPAVSARNGCTIPSCPSPYAGSTCTMGPTSIGPPRFANGSAATTTDGRSLQRHLK